MLGNSDHQLTTNWTQVFVADGNFGKADGIVGLAFQPLADGCSASGMLDELVGAGQLSSGVFSFYLSADPGSRSSEITFGGTRSQYMAEPFKFHKLISEQDYWAVRLSVFPTLPLCDKSLIFPLNALV